MQHTVNLLLQAVQQNSTMIDEMGKKIESLLSLIQTLILLQTPAPSCQPPANRFCSPASDPSCQPLANRFCSPASDPLSNGL